MLQAEENYIDKMFEAGDIEGIKASDLKQLLENVLMKNLQNSGTATVGSTLNLIQNPQVNLIGFTILQVGIPTLIFLLFVLQIILKLMKAKTLMTYGNEKM